MNRLTIAAMACILLASLPVYAKEKIFGFDDQYVQIDAGVTGEGKSSFAVEIQMAPKPGWKLLADNSASTKPLRLKFTASKCLKLKGGTSYSKPDVSGTDESGSYSEYYTKTASIRQEFARQKCDQKSGFNGSATLVYLLCQDNKCVGPFSREMKFRVQ